MGLGRAKPAPFRAAPLGSDRGLRGADGRVLPALGGHRGAKDRALRRVCRRLRPPANNRAGARAATPGHLGDPAGQGAPQPGRDDGWLAWAGRAVHRRRADLVGRRTRRPQRSPAPARQRPGRRHPVRRSRCGRRAGGRTSGHVQSGQRLGRGSPPAPRGPLRLTRRANRRCRTHRRPSSRPVAAHLSTRAASHTRPAPSGRRDESVPG